MQMFNSAFGKYKELSFKVFKKSIHHWHHILLTLEQFHKIQSSIEPTTLYQIITAFVFGAARQRKLGWQTKILNHVIWSQLASLWLHSSSGWFLTKKWCYLLWTDSKPCSDSIYNALHSLLCNQQLMYHALWFNYLKHLLYKYKCKA